MSEARELMENQVLATVLRNGYSLNQANFMIPFGLAVKGEWIDGEHPTVKFDVVHDKQKVTMIYYFENSCDFSNRPYVPGDGLPRQTDMTAREVTLYLSKVIFSDGSEQSYEEAIWSQRTITLYPRPKALIDFQTNGIDYLQHIRGDYWQEMNTKGFDPKYGMVAEALLHLKKLIRSRNHADKRDDDYEELMVSLFGDDVDAFRPVLAKLRAEISIIVRVHNTLKLIATAHNATKGK